MATSGYIQDDMNFGYFRLSWSESSQSVANNTTTISYTLSVYSQYNVSSSAGKSYWIKINGVTVASGTNYIGGSGTRTLKTGSVTIPHGADGKKTFAYSFYNQAGITWDGSGSGDASASGNGVLDTIARASTPTLSVSSQSLGSVITIYTNRASTFTHTLVCTFGNQQFNIALSVADSYAWTLPDTLANAIPSATSGLGSITCHTYSGTTLIGSKSVNFTANVPNNTTYNPSIGNITASEANTAITIGAYVQGMSKVKLTMTGISLKYGATVKTYKLEFNGETWSSSTGTSDFVKSSGTLVAKATITDSRGRTDTHSVNVTVLAYSPPSITTLSIGRSNSNETDNEVGTYAKITRIGSASSLKVGTVEKNTLKYTVYIKERSVTSWGTAKVPTTTVSGLSLTGYNNLGTYDITKSYDVRVELTDLYNTTIALGVLSTGQVTMSWGRTGIGVGKVWEKGTLDIGGDVYTEGFIEAMGHIKASSIYLVDGTASYEAIRLRNSGETHGHGLYIGAGGTTVIGGGESAFTLMNDAVNGVLNHATETTIITSDNGVEIWAGVQNGASYAKKSEFTKEGNLNVGGNMLTIDSGTQINHSIELGSRNATGGFYSFIDFHSSQHNNDYDGRIIFYGGNSGSNAKAKMTVYAHDVLFDNTGYIDLRAYSGYGTGSARIWYDHSNKYLYFWHDGNGYIGIKASAFTVNSKRESKTNIVKDESCALDKVKRTTIYDYHLKSDLETQSASSLRKQKGLIVEESPEELIEDEGINLYSMNAMLWKAVQELSAQVEVLSEKIKRR
jgi:hypothetical protein